MLAKGCLAPDLTERPRHAGEVAEFVAAYQARVQERLKQAEIERAQAQVKAAEERKRRRLAVSLGALVVLFLVGVGAAGWWYQHEQAERALAEARREAAQTLRQEQAAAEVKVARGEAVKLRERALTSMDHPESWKATLETARSAVKRAQGLLQQEPQLAATALAKEVQQTHAKLEEDENDRQLVVTFEDVQFKVLLSQERDEHGYRHVVPKAYQEVKGALAKWGLPLGGVAPERVKVLIQGRPSAMRHQLVGILQWCSSWAPFGEPKQSPWLREVLLTADPDPWRQQVRQALFSRNQALVQKLAAEADVAKQPPAFLEWLAVDPLLKNNAGHIALLRRAQQRHPQDFWVNIDLAGALERSVFPTKRVQQVRGAALPVLNKAIRCYTAALALRPKDARVHTMLGAALWTTNNLEAASAHCRRAIELDPRLTPAYIILGHTLWARKDLTEAITCYKKAMELDPGDPVPHYVLGTRFSENGKLDEAIESFNKALRIDPKYVNSLGNLGVALYRKKEYQQAAVQFQKALDLDPRNAPAHEGLAMIAHRKGDLPNAIAAYNRALEHDPKIVNVHYLLGEALTTKNDLKGAIACYHKALALDPNHAKAHVSLGKALAAQKDWKAAVDWYRKALGLDSQSDDAHLNLGLALTAQGDLTQAIAHYQKALTLDSKNANAHGALGHALLESARFAEAQKALERALALLPADDTLRRPYCTQLLHDCKLFREMDTRLPAILKDDDQPKNARERLILADLCGHYRKHYTTAVRFFADFFAAEISLSTEAQARFRYHAARAAALAAAGKGKDAPKLDKEKSRLRQQALEWLRDSLKLYTNEFEKSNPTALRLTLNQWWQDADLFSVRDARELARLPEAERTAWQQLWADVEERLQKVSAPSP
jgi:tetratricopeptide (TPR) repeat protein